MYAFLVLGDAVDERLGEREVDGGCRALGGGEEDYAAPRPLRRPGRPSRGAGRARGSPRRRAGRRPSTCARALRCAGLVPCRESRVRPRRARAPRRPRAGCRCPRRRPRPACSRPGEITHPTFAACAQTRQVGPHRRPRLPRPSPRPRPRARPPRRSRSRRVDLTDQGRLFLPHLPREARPEQRVHDEVRPVQHPSSRRADEPHARGSAAPRGSSPGRRRTRPWWRDGDIDAGPVKLAGDDEAVAAVVAAAADHERPASGGGAK